MCMTSRMGTGTLPLLSSAPVRALSCWNTGIVRLIAEAVFLVPPQAWMLYSYRIWQRWLLLQPQPRPQPPAPTQTLSLPQAAPWELSRVPVSGMGCFSLEGDGSGSGCPEPVWPQMQRAGPHMSRKVLEACPHLFDYFVKGTNFECLLSFSKEIVGKGFQRESITPLILTHSFCLIKRSALSIPSS